jgi:hypothetical protein
VRCLATAAVGSLLLASNAQGQETTRVSVSSSGQEGRYDCYESAISADGNFVAFSSSSDDLVSGDTNNSEDVFVHDRTTGVTERVSVSSSGIQGNFLSLWPALSADGRYVAFTSYATNLVSGDTNGQIDVFVHDRQTGATERVSVDSSGNQGDDFSIYPSLSSDGRFVAFRSLATNLVAGDTNSAEDVFVRDRTSKVTERVSVDSSGGQGNSHSYDGFADSISADGSVVTFYSDASNLVANDNNGVWDVFVHDRNTGLTERVSVDSTGVEGDGQSEFPAISADGRYVAFWSQATNLVASGNNATGDVFVYDRTTALVLRVSVDSSGAEGNDASYSPAISGDGQTVAFSSLASNLVAADTNALSDTFAHDLPTGFTELESVSSAGVQGGNRNADDPPSISADGRVVSFTSHSQNLVPGDTNHRDDVFVHERCSTVASWSNYGSGFPGSYGVPALTSQQNPVLGTTITVDLDNSLQAPTTGLLFLGFQQTDIPTNRGGHLLVVPAFTVPITFSFGPDSFSGALPQDVRLCGTTVEVQAIELDPGAAFGISFTPGLEFVLGV